MTAELLNEPELEFGGGFRHVDIRFGIMSYGPFDVTSEMAPKRIRIGIVGTEKTVERFLSWLEQCKSGLAAKTGNKPNLFPRFPGLAEDVGLRTTIVTGKELIRTIHRKSISEVLKIKNHNEAVTETVELFLRELDYVTKSKNVTPNVLVCAPPIELFQYFEKPEADDEDTESEEDAASEGHLDFHDLLKAKSLSLLMPIQFVRPSTYDPSARETRKKGTVRQLQDPATRAWNFYTALYYKAGGTPWRLLRDPSDYASCFVGISFYRSLDQSSVSTSVAQVFNERGQGVILRGGPAEYVKDDRQPHLPREDAYRLLKKALEAYRDEHETLPARVVVHKSSIFTESEHEGLQKAIDEMHVSRRDFVTLSRSFTRFFRVGAYPPLRGTFISLDDERSILYTKASVEFFKLYPGLYVPKTLLIHSQGTDQTSKQLATETLALTKLNWNNTQFDSFFPITLKAARQVGDILRHLSGEPPELTRYAYYM
jgi:hypothetical protein